MKYRHLGRTSAHRQALLRNLVTSLFTHETIQTTWPKAKEAQRLAEKLITLGKKNTEASKRRALSIFFVSSLLSHGLGCMEMTGLRKANSDRHHTPSFLNSLDRFANAMPNARADTQGCCASSR